MEGDDKTVFRATAGRGPIDTARSITIRFQAEAGTETRMQFTREFIVGRGQACDVQIDSDMVSRRHLRIYPHGNVWCVQDLNSANGTYLNMRRIVQAELADRASLRLGTSGPYIELETAVFTPPEFPAASPPAESLTQLVQHYFEPGGDIQAGDRTKMIQRAFKRVSKKQSRRYITVIGVVAISFSIALAVLGFEYFRLQADVAKFEAEMADLFYEIKDLELALAEIPVEQSAIIRTKLAEKEASYDDRHDEMTNRRGDTFLSRLGLVEKEPISPVDKLILRMARVFGECEYYVPEEFSAEVKKYIAKWKSTKRLPNAIARAQNNGYTPIVQEVMLGQYLPPQFFYLALQESNFNKDAIGPETRWGIAKGIWQFIPDTGRRYGLQPGPLLKERKYDPRDDRFDFAKATRAAASYLKDIYTTEAQASGLLVMASYNWGENRVRKILRGMPEDPRERNFWKLLKEHDIPKQTYDYVLHIFSAAVIGENPRLFGFEFDDPLKEI